MATSDSVRTEIKVFALAAIVAAGLLTYLTLDLATPREDGPERGGREVRQASEPRHGWRSRGAPVGPGVWRGDSYGAEEPQSGSGIDPQWESYLRSYRRGGDGGVGPEFGPQARTARVASIEGASPVDVGAVCDVRVLPVRSQAFNCLVRVTCEDVVLYPDHAQRAGYAPCELGPDRSPRRAQDQGVTNRDGDPALDADFDRGRVIVRDELPGGSFQVSLDVG